MASIILTTWNDFLTVEASIVIVLFDALPFDELFQASASCQQNFSRIILPCRIYFE